jgi:hypothetical protein
MLIAFELSMPGKASWNGKWSGEGRPYVRVRSLAKAEAEKVLLSESYDYRWDDGWCACVSVRKVLAREAEKLRKKTVGFCGYDWMIDSIIAAGKIEVRRRPQEAGEGAEQ